MTLLAVFPAVSASAQFHTVTKGDEIESVSTMEQPVSVEKQPEMAENNEIGSVFRLETKKREVDVPAKATREGKKDNARKCDDKKFSGKDSQSRKTDLRPGLTKLPELTIPNLYAEIQRHGIQYPKIVLAQAILETGWFRSHTCRKKNNLFGLTNPRTGKYFEFGHWTDSVKAYYTKVQYRYTGGNYLLWLKKIGYAEDKGYIRAVIKVLRML